MSRSRVDVRVSKKSIYIAHRRETSNNALCAVVTGCADPPVPRHAIMRRDDNDVVISCNNTSQNGDQQLLQWRLTCRGSRWLGTRYNCSTAPGTSSSTTIP